MNLRFEKRQIGEPVRYPGHPVVIAYLITQKYQSLNEASKKGISYPRASEDKDIPGAANSVYAALEFLYRLRDANFDTAYKEAQETWKTIAHGYNDDVIAHGAKQALIVKEKVIEKLKSWK